MFEALVILVLFIGLVLASGRRARAEQPPTIELSEYADLPCPWCRAASRESDAYCTSCGQTFGVITPGSPHSAQDPHQH